jgi:hypothetical protein
MKNVKPISIYNPKHPDFIDISCKPDPKELYGGPAIFNDDGQNQRTVGHIDSKGNYIRCNPKDIGLKKNIAAKSKPTAYINYNEFKDVESIVSESKPRNEVYFAEYGYTEIKQSYKYKNEDSEEIVNPRWARFIKLTKAEKAVLKAARP